MRNETRDFLSLMFNQEQITDFYKFADIIENHTRSVEKQMRIWEFDQEIGGLGGYACPLNPVINPFNAYGDFRNVFRSLQYARSDMYYGSRPRHIILSAGLHLESVVKVVKKQKIPGIKLWDRDMIGKNVNLLVKHELINCDEGHLIRALIIVYNMAKHDTDESRSSTFDYMDSISFYFGVRIIGNRLLRIIDHESCDAAYDINTMLKAS